MTGTVQPSLELIFPVRLRATDGSERTVGFVLDTGFDGELALPGDVLIALDAPLSHVGQGRLANGEVIDINIHETDVFWNGGWTTALVEGLSNPLIGVRMCRGHRLAVRFEPSEHVELEPLG